MSLFTRKQSIEEKSHVLVVVSNKWQLSGFISAAARHQPKRITIVKLVDFDIDFSELQNIATGDIRAVNALGIHQPNFRNFLEVVKHSFYFFDSFKCSVLDRLPSDRFLIITDNEHRSVEYFLRFCLKSIYTMHIYEHGLVKSKNNLYLLSILKLKSITRWIVFCAISLLKYKSSIWNINRVNKYYYSTKSNPINSKYIASGNIFFYANVVRLSKLQICDGNALIFFSSGAFRTSDGLFIEETIKGYLGAKHYAEKFGFELYVKLKKSESKEYLMATDKFLSLKQFIDSKKELYQIISDTNPKVIICSDYSTLIAEAIMCNIDILMYKCNISVPYKEKWKNAGIKMISSNGTIYQKKIINSSPSSIVKNIYNLDCAKEHLNEVCHILDS